MPFMGKRYQGLKNFTWTVYIFVTGRNYHTTSMFNCAF